jgi:transposase
LTKENFDKHIHLKDREVNLTDEIKIDRDLNSAINIATKIMGECLPHFETLEFHKMYMDNQSNFICI